MQPGVYQLINRQSGTALELLKNDYTRVAGYPPCDDAAQKWEIAPLGAGYTIRNMHTGTYFSMKELRCGAPVFVGHFPTAWQLVTVKVSDENTEMIEIHWPNTGFMFDLRNGTSTPGSEVGLTEMKLDPQKQRCRLWKPVFLQHINHSVCVERAQEDDETSDTTTINAADVPEGGELVLVTTTTTRTVVTKVPRRSVCMI
ncbi:uncharacterized protein EDB91DRAFT_1106906 [Suillus paluster]|uniref:uncharacterized protein n=1 Tax=Suillus paluster TaxID=48578 RepID=UPI001B864EA6|nr:uncharacterized protein EDB91DRAFT_1106906 [Suillus paluster]KAG1750367.1 hypothetical protein EDB91DRAFT_1106906 [Suillus paluster]